MKLAIADPPYPPFIGSGGRKNRASRWYGAEQRSSTDRPSDFHPAASDWNDPARHRELLETLMAEYDGWAIATSPDGLSAYHPIPKEARILSWVKPNAQPGAHRLISRWEAVILYPPIGRRSNRHGAGSVSDVLIANAPRVGFIGAKPIEWTEWVLAALSAKPDDEIVDLFPGSNSVSKALT